MFGQIVLPKPNSQSPHGSVSIFDPAMVLLKLVVRVHVGRMQNLSTQFTLDCCGIEQLRSLFSPTEERFGGRKVPMLAQHYIDQRTIAIIAR